MNDLVLRPPASGIARNPLLGINGADMRVVPVGASLHELAEAAGESVVVCRLNGEFISRLTAEEHDHLDALLAAGKKVEADAYEALCVRSAQGWRNVRLTDGDVVEWYAVAQSNALRLVVGLVAIAAGVFFEQPWLVKIGIGIALGGALGLLAGSPQSQAQALAAGSVFTTSLQGNQARLNQPIWKVCGRRKISPPFAAMPYQRWVNAGTDVDNKQYYYAVFAATIGDCDLETALIGGTPISHFQDVRVSAMLAPGVQPSTVSAAIETSTVVASNVLDTGVYVGGFAACKPQRTCTSIELDLSATRGITQQMKWRVEVRPINDFGSPLGAWVVVANEARTGNTGTPQQWTYAYKLLGGPFRPEVRVVRTDTKNTASTALHEISWIALRGILAQAATLDASTTHYEIVLRASAQLSQYSQRDIALILRAKCPTWNSTTGWGAPVYTRNPAWWALDCVSSASWGLGEPDARIDLQSFADLAAVCDARQDHFDYCFDQPLAAWDALQLIARTARARVFRRNGVISIARDDLQTLPVTAFSSRNTVPGSITLSERLPTREMPDGVVVEYEDARTWLWTPIECPCPTPAPPAPSDPFYANVTALLRLAGNLTDYSAAPTSPFAYVGASAGAAVYSTAPLRFGQPMLRTGPDSRITSPATWKGVEIPAGACNFGTGPFTIEGEFYWTVYPDDAVPAYLFWIECAPSPTIAAIGLIFGTYGYSILFHLNSGTFIAAQFFPVGGRPPLRKVNTYAFTRDASGNLLVHINGVYQGATPYNGSFSFAASITGGTIDFGSIRTSVITGAVVSYMGQQRITAGVARYSSANYAPATAPFYSPGFSFPAVVSSLVNPVRLRIEGIVGPTHARREGLYEAAKLAYRTRDVTLKTEMEGTLPAFMAPVAVQPDIVGYGQTGDVAFVDATGTILTLTEPPAWGAADLYLRLRRDDGSMTSPVRVTPGPGSNDVTLPAPPDFALVLNDAGRERPIFLLGPLVGGDELAKVAAILDGGQGNEGEQLYEIRGVIDDVRVHAADNAYLPGVGVIQDPLDPFVDTGSSGLISLATLASHTIVDGSYNNGVGLSASVTFKNDGTLIYTCPTSGSGSFAGEWNIVPITPTQAATADIRFTLQPSQLVTGIGQTAHVSGSALSAGSAATGVMLSLGTSRTIGVDTTLTSDGSAVIGQVLCEIFDHASGVLQSQAVLVLVAWAAPELI